MKKISSQIKKAWFIPLITLLLVLVINLAIFLTQSKNQQGEQSQPEAEIVITDQTNSIKLPTPSIRGSLSVESALKNVRPRRAYEDDFVSLENVSQMLWAAQGVTVDWGDRTTPSAKSTYPLSVYLVSNKIENLSSGLYQYIPGERLPVHALKQITQGEYQKPLFNAMNQNSMKNPAGVIVITGDMAKMANAYGGISHDKEVYLEAGHATQNIYLQAESLKLGLVALSNFDDSTIRNIITIPEGETIIYLIPFGQIKD